MPVVIEVVDNLVIGVRTFAEEKDAVEAFKEVCLETIPRTAEFTEKEWQEACDDGFLYLDHREKTGSICISL